MVRMATSSDEAPALRRVRGVAAELGVTLEDVAATIGLSRNGLSRRYASTNGDFTSRELLKLCRKYGVPITRFFPDDVAPKREVAA